MIGSYILIGIVVIVILAVATMFNTLVTKRNRMREAWSDIDVQLKRRYDLIPNLVETVKGYATHEQEVFEHVAEVRASIAKAQGVADKIQAENQLSQTLKSLFAVAENYPQLRASENFMAFQKQLEDTENKIQAARRFYNSIVMDYNTALQQFPTNTIGRSFGFQDGVLFTVPEEEEQKMAAAPPVNFS